MTILHVLSQFEVTGAEVYAVTLAEEQRRRGHCVIMVSDTLTTPTTAEYVAAPIGNRKYLQRIKNVLFLKRLVVQHRVGVVHAHSRAASWIANIAAWLADVPLISSVHGRQHLHVSSKSFNVYGRRIVAVNRGLKEHLVRELGIPAEFVTVISNGIDFDYWSGPPATATRQDVIGVDKTVKVILVAGRFSGPKGDVARTMLESVAPKVLSKQSCTFCFIGGRETPEDIQKLSAELRSQFGTDAVRLLGFQPDVRPFYQAADVVVGAGRVAVEAVASGRPVIGVGESHYVGRVDADSFVEAADTNFGDTGTKEQLDPSRMADDIVRILQENWKPNPLLLAAARAQFDLHKIADRIDLLYREARIAHYVPRAIPVLMYHRVVTSAPVSRHGLWVTATRFEQQLRSLRQRHIEPITFEEYDAFVRGERELPSRPIILTFDDGYTDNYEVAYPLLKQFGMKAVVYLVADLRRRFNVWDPDEPQVPLMTAEQIREMSGYGIEFGSHTVSHTDLSRVEFSKVQEELKRSKDILEELLGKPVVSFAYPYGRLTVDAKRAVREAGYRYAVAADSGPLRFSEDVFEIRRSQVFPWTNGFGFWKKTQPWYLQYKARKSSR